MAQPQRLSDGKVQAVIKQNVLILNHYIHLNMDRKRLSKSGSIISGKPESSNQAPPPPYSSQGGLAAPNADSKDQAQFTSPQSNAPLSYPMQSHHMPAPVQTLNFKYSTWTGRYVNVFSSSEENPIYVIKCKTFKPQMIFSTPSAGQATGVGGKVSKSSSRAAAAVAAAATMVQQACNFPPLLPLEDSA